MENTKREIGKVKKAYEKPQIIYWQPLEAVATACPGTEGNDTDGKAIDCSPIAS